MKKIFYLAALFLSVYACKKNNSGSGNGGGSDTTGTGGTSGAVSTFVGSATSTPFSWPPTGICADSKGNIYVSEEDGSVVVKITSNGTVTTLAGSGVPGCEVGTGTAATFTFPYEICSDAHDNIYVADRLCSGLKTISQSGVVTVFCASDFVHGVNLGGPITVCSDPQGNFYCAGQLGSDNITKITSAGVGSHFAGDGTTGFKDGTVDNAEFMDPTGICADANGNVYVADGHRIRKISNGQVTTIAGSATVGYVDGKGASAEFGGAMGLCVDSKGNVYVADVNNSVIRMVTPDGTVSTVAGNGSSGYKDGDPKVAEFNQPSNLCFDPNGNLFIADYGNSVIRKIKMN